MNATQYGKLLGEANSLNATLNFNKLQINEFAARCVITCRDLSDKSESINSAVLSLGAPPLAKQQLDALHGMQAIVDKCVKSLKQDIEKPCLQYRKNLEKIEIKSTKLLRTLDTQIEPCAFNLNVVRTILLDNNALLLVCRQNLDRCFTELAKNQAKLASTSLILQNMDLPSTIEHVTRDVEKIAKELAGLHLQFSTQPDTRLQYSREFLPLRTALLALNSQSVVLTTEAELEASRSPAPDLKL